MNGEGSVDRGKDLKLTALAIAICLVIAGGPIFIYMATMDNARPEDAVDGFFDAVNSKDYEGAIDHLMWNFEEPDRLENISEGVKSLMHNIQFRVESMERFETAEGLEIGSILSRVLDLEAEYGVEIKDWSAIRIDLVQISSGYEPIDDTIYTLQFLVDGEWYMDFESIVSYPASWNQWTV